jgi:ketosteroid isomerase-like protein
MLTEATLKHHLQAFSQGVDAILSDYTDDSVLFTPDGPVRGLERLRAFFDGFIRNSPPDLLDAVRLIRQDVDGEVAYLVWKAEPYITMATDTFVIRNGKIMVQTFVALS